MIIFSIFLLALSNVVYAYKQVPIGNFAVGVSQRPRPFFCFGQNLVDKGDFLISDTIIALPGKRRREFINIFNFLYGFTDYFHAFLAIPAPIYRKYDATKATKIGNVNIQAEYQFLTKENKTSATKATLYGNIFMPSGILAEPSPVNYSQHTITHKFPGLLLGTIWNHTTIDWYVFAALANLFVFKNKNIQPGQIFFFQSGIGHNLGIYNDKILLLLLELYFVRNQGNKVSGVGDVNSGGYAFFVGPSLWYSTERIIFQAGIDIPAMQILYGDQPRSTVFVGAALTWKY